MELVDQYVSDSTDQLISRVEALHDAVKAKNRAEGLDRLMEFSIVFVRVFGHAESIINRTLPIMEKIKGHIMNEEFEDADTYVLALLISYKQLKTDLIEKEARGHA